MKRGPNENLEKDGINIKIIKSTIRHFYFSSAES